MLQVYLRKQVFTLLCLLISTSWWGCKKSELSNSIPTSSYDPALVQQWMTEAYQTVKREGLFALDASRVYAYTSITAYEAMVHGMEDHRSLEGQLHGFTQVPKPDPEKRYDWGIVLCHAVPKVLSGTMPVLSTASQNNIQGLASTQENELEDTYDLDAEVIANSKAYAEELADYILEWSKGDNRELIGTMNYVEPSRVGNPQYWTGSTLNQTFMMPFWWMSRTFVSPSYTICEPKAPYQYSTDPASDYYRDIKEVYDASFDPAKVFIGQYWANNPGVSGTPAGSWLGIASQLVDQFDLGIEKTLEMWVMLSIGTRDVFISVWYTKYKWNLQRPVTYIREVMGHGSWNSVVPTPPYPDYLSGTSANAGVSSAILTHLFGNRSFTDRQHLDKGMGERKFNSFYEAGVEAYHSRIYGGVHMRRACEEGFTHGQCVANTLISNLQLQK